MSYNNDELNELLKEFRKLYKEYVENLNTREFDDTIILLILNIHIVIY